MPFVTGAGAMVRTARYAEKLAAIAKIDRIANVADRVRATQEALKGLKGVNRGYAREGCEAFAKKVQGAIGGEIVTIKPLKELGPNMKLGERLEGGAWEDTYWSMHQAVVKDGRVYDAMTGAAGLPIDEYKATWKYADEIAWPF